MHTYTCTIHHTHAHTYTHTHTHTHTPPHTAADGVPSDDVYERAVNLATTVYQLEGEGEMASFVPVHENSNQMLRIALLNTKKVFEFITITTPNELSYLANLLSLSNEGLQKLFTSSDLLEWCSFSDINIVACRVAMLLKEKHFSPMFRRD